MIAWTLDGAIASLSLTRPEARNAISRTAWGRIEQALAAIAGSDARVLILHSGVRDIFSAGADITEFEALRTDPAARTRFRLAMRGAIEALATLAIPTIAAIDGGCFGAAVALVLACDIRIAASNARFATTPAKLGIGYPAEDVARLIAQIGRGQASRMLFSANPIECDEALRIGLIELAALDAEATARQLAAQIARNAPEAVRLLKRTLADPADPRHADAFDAAFGTGEFAGAFAAFRARLS